MTQETTTVFPDLHDYRYANLITFRKSGEEVPTTIWFAIEDGKLYVTTGAKSGKVKRIRNNAHVLLEASTMQGKTLGPRVTAHARVMSADEEIAAKIALNRKYGLVKSAFDFFMALTGQDRENVYLEIVPA
ncbi:MAG: PPOX class F420-dependent oxidoreductase [Chloroflexaceae bacterium]|nr:PPOX class F420-dependent oxidoreductase [Chloroflexaceae bacterium]